MNNNRSSGVLLPIFSLPGEYGCGNFGKAAFDFVDLLKDCGFHYWQVLPFTNTDACNSPYKSDSAFAGNLNFIDPEGLFTLGLVTEEELAAQKFGPEWKVSYDLLKENRLDFLKTAFGRCDAAMMRKIRAFAKKHAWLQEYALYMAIRDTEGCDWMEWKDPALRDHLPEAVEAAKKKYKKQMEFYYFVQYIFFTQWQKVKDYANENEVYIIGDMPIYVSFESCDVWSQREMFDLDEKGYPQNVAGVPPDYFSPTGQKWGNPLYNWKAMREDGYTWWKERLMHTFKMVDKVRIDHFRAFSAYWAVPAEDEDAMGGEWIPGEGMKFLNEMYKHVDKESIIAEDLGVQDEELTALLKDSGLPGMRVMQFGFLSSEDDMHLPHNYPHNMIAYTGTHDNKPLLAYLWELSPAQREYCLSYCGFVGEDWQNGGSYNPAIRAMIETLWKTQAKLVVSPIQDLCGFGGDTTMNCPGTNEGNWMFRMTSENMAAVNKEYLKKINHLYKRA